MSEKHHYCQSDLTHAIRETGVQAGDVVFSHVAMGMLGYPKEGTDEATVFDVIVNAMKDAVGPGGTLFIPTFSYSFCKQDIYDPLSTPSAVGPFSERFRNLPGVKRSLDPIFSVAGLGPKTDELIRNLPHDCFGKDCFYERLTKIGGKICNVGVGFRNGTFLHHVEQETGVPYRFLKLFSGFSTLNGEQRKEGWLYYVRILSDNCRADRTRIEKLAKSRGLCRTAAVGIGEITCIDCEDYRDLARDGIGNDPWFLAEGPPEDSLKLEQKRITRR